jgi:two-component system sensor histidine kinase SenX3
VTVAWLAGATAVAVAFVVGWLLAVRRSGRPPAEREHEPVVDADRTLVREALDHLDIGVVVADRRGKVTYRNGAASVWAGTHAGVIVDDRLRRAFAEAGIGASSTHVVELHGPPRTTLALAVEPMPEGAVATIHDVSERVRIDAMRTDFVANISHELKTPVGAIAVLAEALAEENDPEVVARVTTRMIEESHRAVRTIDDLLELSRIESAERRDEEVTLASVMQAAMARGRVVDEGRGVRVLAEGLGDAERTVLYADGRQLISGLGNLVENAVKYSHDGGVVRVVPTIGDQHVDVAVVDDGVGIPARDLGRVFERFYRVDKARSRETGGTGLGLAIARHIATNHGGDVTVVSEEGVGSTFTLRLPTSIVRRGVAPAPERPGDAERAPAVQEPVAQPAGR